MSFQETLTVNYVPVVCATCGLRFCMTMEWNNERRRVQDAFYCPAGHRQTYTGEKPEEALKRRVEYLETDVASKRNHINHLERSRSTLRGAITKLKKKIKRS